MAASFKQIFLVLSILTLGWAGFEAQSFLYQPPIAQAQNAAVIRQINDSKTYIVNEMKFATSGSVTLKTTPCFGN